MQPKTIGRDRLRGEAGGVRALSAEVSFLVTRNGHFGKVHVRGWRRNLLSDRWDSGMPGPADLATKVIGGESVASPATGMTS
jgi:hypothetical protein